MVLNGKYWYRNRVRKIGVMIDYELEMLQYFDKTIITTTILVDVNAIAIERWLR